MKPSKIKLGYKERDKLFKKEFTELKIKVALNWFEIIVLLCITFFISMKLHDFIMWENQFHPIIISIISCIVVTAIFAYFRKYQLTITRFHKENIYKKISAELLEKSKNEN